MSPLVARPAEPLTEDPFAGGNTASVPDFDGTRLTELGATEEEVAALGEHFDAASRDDRRQFAAWLADATDVEVTGWLATWRDFAEKAAAEAALIEGTVEEVLARISAAPEDEQLDLAERTLTAEENQEPDDVRTTLTEALTATIAKLRDDAAAKDAQVAEQRALVDGKVDDVLARVGKDQDLAKRTLEAERELAGDKARKTLVAELEAIIAEPAPSPTEGAAESDGDGSGGPETPEEPGSLPSDQQGDAAGASDATS